ncbi:MAG TPA: DNA topoisomerase III [Spirochaetales bacterium]|nr:DNA topoisomerase III [Spirochaetales bacterium]
MKTIVLAEKPSVGRELARVLGCTSKYRSYSEGKNYIVTWAMGHLIELADPHIYNEKWRTWSLDTLPMLPERMKHKVIKRTSGQFRVIKDLFKRGDVGELIIATDAGREGELVARLIMRLGGWKGPVKRLWISSQTDRAIKEGFNKLKPGRDYENLFKAAECRAEADWIIGLNISRALSCKYDARLSAGRVQTPTMALIIMREEEINNFQAESYWQVQADFGSFTGLWKSSRGATRIKEQKRAQEIALKVRDREAEIIELIRKEKQEPPPLAFDLTALQREANARLGFTAHHTLSTLQGLYERHKIVTYPRTDSRHITGDIVDTLKMRLKAVLNSRFEKIIREILTSEVKPGKRFVDDSKVSDHHAIIPTEERVELQRLNGDERALWEMIVKRFLAVLLPVYRYQSITITTRAAGEHFVSRGIQVIDRGWRKIENPEEKEEEEERSLQNLAAVGKGDTFKVLSAVVRQGFTKPPSRYTEGTLLDAMENAGRFIADRELRRSLAGGGLGTAATRAEIIEKLLSNYYIERNGKTLYPTSRGIELFELVPEQLRSPELTARWEQRLARIAGGNEKNTDFSRDIRSTARELVEKVKKSTAQFQPKNLSSTPCPICGKMMMAAKDKKGRKRLVCHSLACGYEQSESNDSSLSHRPSKREKAVTRQLVRKYSDHSAETSTFGDLIKASMERKKG